MSKVLLISVKPEFADKILEGSKTIELRKSSPNVQCGDLIVLYSTIPVAAVVGICRVGGIIKCPPQELWELHSNQLGIDYSRYEDYYKDMSTCIGIKLEKACSLRNKLPLLNIKRIFPSFSPPQTFRYFTKTKVLRGFLACQLSV